MSKDNTQYIATLEAEKVCNLTTSELVTALQFRLEQTNGGQFINVMKARHVATLLITNHKKG